MLGRLLEGLPRHSYQLLTNTLHSYRETTNTGQWLGCNYWFVDQTRAMSEKEIRSITHRRKRTVSLLSVLWLAITSLKTIFIIPRRARWMYQSHPYKAILVTTDNGPFLIGGYMAAVRLKLPLHVFLFDLYADNNLPIHAKLLARFFESRIFRHATTIFVNNRHTKEYLQKKYQFNDDKFVICPNPILKIPHLQKPAEHKTPTVKTVTFTGNIYWAQQPNVSDLITASTMLSDVRIRIHAPWPDEKYIATGMYGKNSRTGKLSQSQAQQAQREADILFLPMTFGDESRSIVETASPGKLSDYLTAARPILVYAPPYSQIARHAREEGFALVVDQQSPQKLAEAITQLLDDKQLRQQLVKNGQRLLLKEYDVTTIHNRFRDRLFRNLGN